MARTPSRSKVDQLRAEHTGRGVQPEVKTYKVADWYWSLPDDPGFVWASARRQRVPVADETYRRHLAECGGTTPIDSIESLRWVWERAGIVQDEVAQYRLARKLRFEAILPIGDQLDAIIKQLARLSDFVDVLQTQVSGPRGDVADPAFKALRDQVEGIKLALPKPAAADGGGDG